MTTKKYNMLNSLFFLPNVITPLLAGVLAKQFGGPSKCLVGATIVYSFGHFLFAAGIEWAVNAAMYSGRVLSGVMYEVIDCLPMAFMYPILKDRWGLAQGVINTTLRLGSVLTFVVCPIMYKTMGNVQRPIWLSAGMTFLGIVAAIVSECVVAAISPNYGPSLCSSCRACLSGQKYESVSVNVSEEDPASDAPSSSNGPVHDALQAYRRIGPLYYLFMLSGALMYGAMVYVLAEVIVCVCVRVCWAIGLCDGISRWNLDRRGLSFPSLLLPPPPPHF